MATPGLTVPVLTPGLPESIQGFDKLGNAATTASTGMVKAAGSADAVSKSVARVGQTAKQTGDAFGGMANRIRSGEVLRNGAASFALMATAGDGLLDKVAALGGAFAAIPGPVGMVSSAVAVGATILNVFTKSAEEAAKKTIELKASLISLGKEKVAAQLALAGKLGAAAEKVGPDLLANIAAGGGGDTRKQNLFGGDISAGLQYSTKMAGSGLDEAAKARVDAALTDQRNAGVRITPDVQDKAIEVIKAAMENGAGGLSEQLSAGAARDEMAKRGGGIFGVPSVRGIAVDEMVGTRADTLREIQGVNSINAKEVDRRFNNSTSGFAIAKAGALDQVNAPAIAEAVRTLSDATNISGINAEALSVATDQNTKATSILTAAVEILTEKITTTTNEIENKQPSGGAERGGNFGGWWQSRQSSATNQ